MLTGSNPSLLAYMSARPSQRNLSRFAIHSRKALLAFTRRQGLLINEQLSFHAQALFDSQYQQYQHMCDRSTLTQCQTACFEWNKLVPYGLRCTRYSLLASPVSSLLDRRKIHQNRLVALPCTGEWTYGRGLGLGWFKTKPTLVSSRMLSLAQVYESQRPLDITIVRG
jgi:hypothetical protein